MRYTTGKLRAAIADPDAFVRSLRFPSDQPNFGNPQRQWLEASLRVYLASGRNRRTLYQSFDARIRGGKQTPRRLSLAAGARRLLEQFDDWDGGQPDPADWFPPAPDIDWRGHILSIRRDLIYLTARGYMVRQLWTDSQLRSNDERARLMAAAVLTFSDLDLGPGRVEAIEAWQLRVGAQYRWTRAELEPLVPAVDNLLGAVEAAITNDE